MENRKSKNCILCLLLASLVLLGGCRLWAEDNQSPPEPSPEATTISGTTKETTPKPTSEPTPEPSITPVPTPAVQITREPAATPAPTSGRAPTQTPTQAPTQAPTKAPTATPAPTVSPETESELLPIDYARVDAVFDLTNIAREEEGLTPFRYPDADLLQAAALRAREAAEIWDKYGQLSHARPAYWPDPGSCFTVLDEYQIDYSCAGENVLYATAGGSAEYIIGLWLDSAGHRANILSVEYTTVAVGFFRSDGLDFYVQIFIGS